jgi:hypothetical protein
VHVQFDTVLKSFVLPFSSSANHLVKWAGGLKARLRKGGRAIPQPAPSARTLEG